MEEMLPTGRLLEHVYGFRHQVFVLVTRLYFLTVPVNVDLLRISNSGAQKPWIPFSVLS